MKNHDNNMIKITIKPQEQIIEIPEKTTALQFVRDIKTRYPVVAIKINNKMKDLATRLDRDCIVELVDISSIDGMRVYQRSLIMVLARAAYEILPGCSVTVKHTLGNGVYGEIEYHRALKNSDIQNIEKRMHEIVENDETISKHQLNKDKVKRFLNETQNYNKINLLKYVQSPTISIYKCGWFQDYSFGIMVPSTGYLKTFRLRYYLPGFILELPRKEQPDRIPEYVEQGKLANIYYESIKLNRILGVRDIASLNDYIKQGNSSELIRLAEAFHEKKIGQIADLITENIDRIRIVLIAGPSSSGKTTFAQRLSTQLKINGIRPVAISLDNYFVDRQDTPLDENGNYDFEHLDALNHELFNEHLIRLIQGEEVEMPSYCFITGKCTFNDHYLKLSPSDLIIVEGIHGLNDMLTRSIPKGRKFKIYISALTQLNLDNLNRIPTTDVRILRRIIRDKNHRGYTARETIARWPSVRRGEEKYIFPFQEDADVMFNSALAYELAVLKKHVEPLLNEIGQEHPEYSEARNLLKFLSYVVSMDDHEIPDNSIIREFIGNGCF